MAYSAAKSINLHAKNVPHHLKEAFEERAARALIHHGGNNVVQTYKTDQWPFIVQRAKLDLQGHFDAEIIRDARFEVG
jgi:hypothetical protein